MTMDVAVFVADAALVEGSARGPTAVLAHDGMIVSVGDPDQIFADPRAARLTDRALRIVRERTAPNRSGEQRRIETPSPGVPSVGDSAAPAACPFDAERPSGSGSDYSSLLNLS